MKVLELMERVESTDTELVVAWIKDAINILQSNYKDSLTATKQNIVKNQRDYDLPAGFVRIHSVSVLDTEDDSKYKSIRRIAGNHFVTEDTSP
jgi:hypothetical protein|tara:strand:- start:1022 stop:1300 length:279 start_codon:yes stop_codon:yes gene_type:complete